MTEQLFLFLIIIKKVSPQYAHTECRVIYDVSVKTMIALTYFFTITCTK